MSGVFIGVDGGGTRTRAVALDAEGGELGRAEGPPSLIDPIHPDRAADAVEETVRALASEIGLTLPFDGLWAGLAGAGADPSRTAVEDDLSRRGLARSVGVGTDVEAALDDAFPDAPGILLISGTGSVAAARGADGRVLRVGGWGALLGDEGSGYRVGLDALRDAMCMADGRMHPTPLLPALLERTGAGSADLLPDWVARASKSDVAALAETIGTLADQGDAAAGHVLADAVDALMDHASALAREIDDSGSPLGVALAGGMLGSAGGLLRSRLIPELESAGFRVDTRDVDASRGAAARARRDGAERT